MFGSRPRRRSSVSPRLVVVLTAVLALLALASTAAAGRYVEPPSNAGWGDSGALGARSSSSGATSSKSSSLTIERPPLLVVGDVMVAAVSVRLPSSATITPPAGWTPIRRDGNVGGTTLSQAAYYKVVVTGDLAVTS
jgi:hypothetical protein